MNEKLGNLGFIHNPTSVCSCWLHVNGRGVSIVYCPEHANARRTAQWLKWALDELYRYAGELHCDPSKSFWSEFNKAKVQLMRAEGKAP